jgi:hypothetical protein
MGASRVRAPALLRSALSLANASSMGLRCDFLSGLETSCRLSDRQFRPLIEAQVARELYELLLGWIEAAPQEANGRPAAPEITASVVGWAIFGAGVRWSRDGAPESEERFADQVLSVIVEGLNL